MELMRHYQRAKRMLSEHRYDEALSLYHHALLYDADNVHMRYDVGQILERLKLYPDALDQYAGLTERLFPARSSGTKVERGINAKLWPHSDPFLVRYRYLVMLSTAPQLAQELLRPKWRELRKWLAKTASGGPQAGAPGGRAPSARPWRVTELIDLRRRLAEHFDSIGRNS